MTQTFLRASMTGAAALILLACTSASTGKTATPAKWQRIFDGRTLKGWTPKIVGEAVGEDRSRTFRVKRGAIRVSYTGYDRFAGRFGHLFYNRPLRYFRLRLRYRFLDGGLSDTPAWARSNSGIMFLSERPAEMQRDQPFPVSIEFQLLGRLDASARPTGAVCTPGTTIRIADEQVKEHCTAPFGPTIENGRWVTAELDVLPSGEVIHRIDGKPVIRYARPALDPADPLASEAVARAKGGFDLHEGHIALQSEGHSIEFAEIELERLQ